MSGRLFHSVLVAEDEALIAMAMEIELSRRGYDVIGFVTTGRNTVDTALSRRPDFIILDLNLAGDMDGFAALRLIREKMRMPAIIVTGFVDEGISLAAASLTETILLSKPASGRALFDAVGRLEASVAASAAAAVPGPVPGDAPD